jgi:hypothetical protein
MLDEKGKTYRVDNPIVEYGLALLGLVLMPKPGRESDMMIGACEGEDR